MNLIWILISIKLFYFVERIECQLNIISSRYEANLIKNKSLNKTEWGPNLLKSFGSSTQMGCASGCIQSKGCTIAEFDSQVKSCNLFVGIINDRTKLIDKQSVNILFELEKIPYKLAGNLVNTIQTNQSSIWAVVVLTDGNIASCSFKDIKIWNSKNKWTLIKSWEAHSNHVSDLILLNDGNLLSCSIDKSITLWSKSDWSSSLQLTGHNDQVRALGFLANGNIVSGGFDSTFRIWDRVNGSLIKTRNTGHIVHSIIVLKNGNLATGGNDAKINLWNLTDYSLITTLNGHTIAVETLLELKSGDLASGAGDLGGSFTDNRIIIWDMITYEIKYTLLGHTSNIFKIIQLQNGNLASASGDRLIKIWDFRENGWKCILNLTGHTSVIYSLAQLPNGSLVSGSGDTFIRVWS